MFISDIFIEEFGGLLNKSIALKSGMNLLVGLNETGKSTVCAFIKYVFYGFSGAKEKERHASLNTGRSAGAVILDKDGRTFRVERRDAGSVHYVAVYDASTGVEFTEWKKNAQTPGDYFFGVSQELYSRSVYVSQENGARLDGGSAEAVSNLLLSGDETVNLRRAQKSLESARKSLKLKKGTGGIIHETEAALTGLKEKRAEAVEVKNKISGYTVELYEINKRIAELSAELEKAREWAAKAKEAKIRIYLDEASRVNTDAEALKHRIADLKKRYTVNGYLPDDAFESKIISAERDIRTFLEQSAGLQTQLEKMRGEYSAEPPKGYESYCELGKSAVILAENKRNQSSLGIYKILIFASVFVFISSLIAIAGALGGLLEGGSFLYTMLGVAVAVGALAIVLRHFPAKRLKKLNVSLKVDLSRTLEQMCAECEEYERRQNVHSKSITDAISKVRANLDSKKNEENVLLKKWGKRTAEEALNEYKSFSTQLSDMRRQLSALETRSSVLDAYLEGYTEEEIVSAKANTSEYTSTKNASAVSEGEIEKLVRDIDAAKERKAQLEVMIADAGAAKLDIAQISADIEMTEKRLAELNTSFSAITLAIEALDGAETNVRQTVSPYLSEHSGEYFVKMTGGKYSSLHIDAEMNLSYLTEGGATLTDSAYLSGGSTDLAWFCLRLALHGKLSERGSVPLILDECFVYFDDERLVRVMELLSDAAQNGTQILLFSASSRELEKADESVFTVRL